MTSVIAVTGITDVPTVISEVPRLLTGTVIPNNATNRTIILLIYHILMVLRTLLKMNDG